MKQKTIKLNDMRYEDIIVGDMFTFERIVDEEAVDTFARLTQDYNPLHMDEAYAKNKEFGGRIVHGMFLGSFFSTLVGMLIPGKRALYLSQDLRFHNPLILGSKVIVSGVVIKKFDDVNVIELKTIIKNEEGTLIVDGMAKVKVQQN